MSVQTMTRPWIGDCWGAQANFFGGVKLLVVGESAHSQERAIGTADENFLIETVNRFLGEQPKWRFYRMLTSLLADKPIRTLSAEDIREVWGSIAFFNYVPVVAAFGPRARPTKPMFEAGAAHFIKFVRSKSPEAILVCGKYNWHWVLTGVGFTGTPWKTPFSHIDTTPAAYVQHPSSAFSRPLWRPVVDELLCQARSKN